MKRNRMFDELVAKIPEETMRRVKKQMSCKWLVYGDECGRGLQRIPCKVDGCVDWEKYEEE